MEIYNPEHYPDPTAARAVELADADLADALQRFRDISYVIGYLLDLAGFTQLGKITLQDQTTGKIYRR